LLSLQAFVSQNDSAQVSLIGQRQDNQDRVNVFVDNGTVLLAVVDGMGGHAGGERAAEVTLASLAAQFAESDQPLLDPQGFLTLALARAHDRVVELGEEHAMDHRPRATCAVCLVQDSMAFWAHVGDSRVYLLRNAAVEDRTRDHSHVELLLREGLISEDEIKDHPMRNFVECCLGGDAALPDMSISGVKRLVPGDTLLVCSDGFWSGLPDPVLATKLREDRPLEECLTELAEAAVQANSPYSDNTTAAALRWPGKSA
jgi:serine/threonine protein phosphatase PrpC